VAVSKRFSLSELLRLCLVECRADAWDTLVEYLQPVIASVVAARVARYGPVTAELVQDLTQDAFVKLCDNGINLMHRIEGFSEDDALAYVKETAANLVKDHFRAEQSQTRCPPSGFADSESLNTVGDNSSVEAVERKILLGEVDRILCSLLPPKSAARDRRVFWLRHRHGMTARAIAAIPSLGLSQKGVEALLRRLNRLLEDGLT
jgi:RNA polymerase sigma-70 factor (ECF subfamily)